MKKLTLCILTFLLAANISIADELRLDKETQYQKKVMEIGFRILNANEIDKRMTFAYVTNQDVNAAVFSRSKKIELYKGLIPFLDNDDEMAGILSHEIAHGKELHHGYWRRYGIAFRPKYYEKKADLNAVDLMVKAGYNPVALIVIMNKIANEPDWFDGSGRHPIGSTRLQYLYEYIYRNYPAYLADNHLEKNIYYQNFLLTSKQARGEFIQQLEKEKNKPTKVKKQKAKKEQV